LLQLVKQPDESTRPRKLNELHWKKKRRSADLLKKKHYSLLTLLVQNKKKRTLWRNLKGSVKRPTRENCLKTKCFRSSRNSLGFKKRRRSD
jgi:hypothetical protein